MVLESAEQRAHHRPVHEAQVAVLVAFALPDHYTPHATSRTWWLQILGRRRRNAQAARLGPKPLCALTAARCTALGAPAFARRPRHAGPDDTARAPGWAAGATRGGAGAQRVCAVAQHHRLCTWWEVFGAQHHLPVGLGLVPPSARRVGETSQKPARVFLVRVSLLVQHFRFPRISPYFPGQTLRRPQSSLLQLRLSRLPRGADADYPARADGPAPSLVCPSSLVSCAPSSHAPWSRAARGAPPSRTC